MLRNTTNHLEPGTSPKSDSPTDSSSDPSSDPSTSLPLRTDTAFSKPQSDQENDALFFQNHSSQEKETFPQHSASGPRYQPLVIVLSAAAGGIVIDRYFSVGVEDWLALAAIALGIWLGLWRFRRDCVASLVLLVAVGSVGGAWYHCQWNWFLDNDLGNFAPQKAEPICLEAEVLAAPREIPAPPFDPARAFRLEPSVRFPIVALGIYEGREWRSVSGRAEVLVQGSSPKIQAGDRVKIFGKISAPPPTLNPGEFDYAGHLRSRRIRAFIHSKTAACISIIQPGSPYSLCRGLDRLRLQGETIFNRYLDADQAELASAIFLGEREHVDPEQNRAYMATGTIHVLSISGLHVGVLAGAMLWLMRLMMVPRAFSALAVAGITGLYALMVDAEPPVVRATILVLLTCGSSWIYRRALGFNSLAAAGLAVLVINPCDLFNIGAQLSFLSMAVLIWIGSRRLSRKWIDPLENLSAKYLFFFSISQWSKYLRGLLEVGLVIWLVTTPLVMARFHLISPIALLLNELLWIPMTLGLLGGFALLACGCLFPPLASFCGLICNTNLKLLDYGVRLAGSIPWSHFWVSGPSNGWLAVFYGSLAVALAFPRFRPPRRWCVALAAVWVAIGMLPSWTREPPDRLRCTFLSVGHGSATVVELPSGQTLLYDVGQMGSPGRAAGTVANYLWSRGITHLDAVVISHPDIDHYNGLPALLEKFSVGVVYVSPVMFDVPSPAVQSLKNALKKTHTPWRVLHAGQRLSGGEHCRIEVLHPPEKGVSGGHNANSLVLLITDHRRRLMLTGDLETEGLKTLLAKEPTPCEVLLAPHHGSRQSNSPELASWCRARWVVLSDNGRWNIPEIDDTYRSAGGETLSTHLTGAVTFTFDEKNLTVEKFRTK